MKHKKIIQALLICIPISLFFGLVMLESHLYGSPAPMLSGAVTVSYVLAVLSVCLMLFHLCEAKLCGFAERDFAVASIAVLAVSVYFLFFPLEGLLFSEVEYDLSDLLDLSDLSDMLISYTPWLAHVLFFGLGWFLLERKKKKGNAAYVCTRAVVRKIRLLYIAAWTCAVLSVGVSALLYSYVPTAACILLPVGFACTAVLCVLARQLHRKTRAV